MAEAERNHGVVALHSVFDEWSATAGVDRVPPDVVTALARSPIPVDSARTCLRLVTGMGADTVVDALHLGRGWAAIAERLATLTGGVPDVELTPDGRAVLRILHLTAGEAGLQTLRTAGPDLDIDGAVDELLAARLVAVGPDGGAGSAAGARVALTLRSAATAVLEHHRWAADEGNAQLLPSLAREMDLQILDEATSIASAPGHPAGAALALRRPVLVAAERLFRTGDPGSAVDLVESIADPLMELRLHRGLHRTVREMCSRPGALTGPHAGRLRLLSARLHLASGESTLCEHLLDGVTGPADEVAGIRWRLDREAALRAGRVDARALRHELRSGLDRGLPAALVVGAGLDVVTRLLRERLQTPATEALDSVAPIATLTGDDLLLARLHVTSAVLLQRDGDHAAARGRLAAASNLLRPHGDIAIAGVVAAATRRLGPVEHPDDDGHFRRVADLLGDSEVLGADRDLVVAVALSEAGSAWAPDVWAPDGTDDADEASDAVATLGSVLVDTAADPEARGPAAASGDMELLTPRERQVAALVTRGSTNREVADRLGISRWTVVTHLSNIMRKWDCSSRLEVALRGAAPAV